MAIQLVEGANGFFLGSHRAQKLSVVKFLALSDLMVVSSSYSTDYAH